MKLIIALCAAALFAFVSTSAEARQRHHHYRHYSHHHTRAHYAMDANGNGIHRHHYARRGGACDGIHRCRCGSTQTAYFGLPRIYNGHNLWLASEWLHAFPHTSFHVGAVGARPGHVLRIVGGASCSSATVSDDAGTYRRNVCGLTFVEVSGGGFTRGTSAQTHHRRHARMASR